jgi:hypothetical protein
MQVDREIIDSMVKVIVALVAVVVTVHSVDKIIKMIKKVVDKKPVGVDDDTIKLLEVMGFVALCLFIFGTHYYGWLAREAKDDFKETLASMLVIVGFILASIPMYCIFTRILSSGKKPPRRPSARRIAANTQVGPINRPDSTSRRQA